MSVTGSDQFKLIDFGLSMPKLQGRKMTQMCGTLQYMAPEVAQMVSYDEKVIIAVECSVRLRRRECTVSWGMMGGAF